MTISTGSAPDTPSRTEPFRLVVVNAGTSNPSSTRMLADRIADGVVRLARSHAHPVTITVLDLRQLATEIPTALVTQLLGPKLTAAVDTLGAADGIVASTPVYKAGPSGLFTSFFQVLDNDLLIAKPVILAATAGTARHALVVDEQMRALFAYMRTVTVPTSLFAGPDDWGDTDLSVRIERAALELVLLMESGFATQVKDQSWRRYQHEFGSAGGAETSIDLDTDLMRLATGGSTRPAPAARAQEDPARPHDATQSSPGER